MGADSERMRLIIEARETASAEIRRLRGELNQLGGAPMVKAQNEIKKLNNQINQLSGASQKGHGVWTKFTRGIAIGNLAAIAGSRAIHGLTSELSDMITQGLQDEQQTKRLSAAIRTAGGDVNTMLPTIKALTDQLQLQTGVSDDLINKGFTQMTRALIPLNDQYRFMRIALDASAASGKSLETVIDLIMKASAGSKMSLERLAAEFSIAKEKGQSFEETLRAIAELTSGAAQAEMEGYAGQVKMLGIQWKETKEIIGTTVIPVLSSALTIINDIIAGAKVSAEEIGKLPLAAQIAEIEMALKREQDAAGALSGISAVLKFDVTGDTWERIKAYKAELAALNVLLAAQTKAGVTIPTEIAIPKPLAEEEWMPQIGAITERIAIPEAVGEEFEEMKMDAIESLGAIDMSMTELQSSIVSMAMGASDGIVDAMMGARGGLKSVFAGMAKDFLRFFVQQAILSILSKFIPGITLALKMFDVPRNDRMARQEGANFIDQFTLGMQERAGQLRPAMAMAGGGLGHTSQIASPINVYVTGNVMTDTFVEKNVSPTLQRLSARNRSGVVTKNRNVTGNADVRLN